MSDEQAKTDSKVCPGCGHEHGAPVEIERLHEKAEVACPCRDPLCGIVMHCAEHTEAGCWVKFFKQEGILAFRCMECDEPIFAFKISKPRVMAS
jgi:DNA-directed RNA polymerase subunit RPC12/RpoP